MNNRALVLTKSVITESYCTHHTKQLAGMKRRCALWGEPATLQPGLWAQQFRAWPGRCHLDVNEVTGPRPHRSTGPVFTKKRSDCVWGASRRNLHCLPNTLSERACCEPLCKAHGADDVCAAAEEPGGERCPLLLSREAAAPGVRAARPGEAPWLCLLLLESAFRGRASIRPHVQMEKPRQKVLKRSDPSPPS